MNNKSTLGWFLSSSRKILAALLISFVLLSDAFGLEKFRNANTVEDLIGVGEEANNHPEFDFAVFIFKPLVFDKLYKNTDSVLPPNENGNIIYIWSLDRNFIGIRMKYKPPPGPSPENVIFINTFIKSGTGNAPDSGSDQSNFFLALIGDVIPKNAPPELKASPTLHNKLNAASEATDDEPMFVGFDTIVNATGGVVVMDGISASCGDVCVRGENSRVIVMNSDLVCIHDCIRVENLGADANNTLIDFAGKRAGIAASSLSAEEKSTILASLNQAEPLLDDYGVAVVNSKMLSWTSPSVAVLRTDFSVQGGTQVLVDRSLLRTNAGDESALLILSQGDGSVVQNSVLSNPNSLNATLSISSNTATARNLLIDRGWKGIGLTMATANLSSSAISTQGRTPDTIKPACKFSFGGDTINSGNYNIVSDGSCNLGGMDDLGNTDPGLFLPDDGSLIPQFALNSPAIDGGPMAVANGRLPCGTTDITGLPRPQDGNGDGVAECDVGPVELQQGADIGPPQSGAFFAFTRDGEGVFVEMLGNGLAVVYIFSYTPDGKFAFWAAGVGKVTRNGIVITKDAFLTTRGGIFGAGFDPATVQRIPFADMSISFPSCSNPRNDQGVLAIAANAELGFGPLLSRTERLTSILACNGALPAQLGRGFSGSLSDPLHDGEGLIVQVISATQVVIMWFTYDSKGNQQWITGVGTINGNTITVTDAFIQTGPHYGPTYDKTARVMVIWGDFTVTFEPDCNQALLSYNSVLAEYGTGIQNLRRLTNLLGVTCGA